MKNTETRKRMLYYKLFIIQYSLFIEPHVSEAFLVEMGGIGPPSENSSSRLSTSVVIDFYSLGAAPNNRLYASVVPDV